MTDNWLVLLMIVGCFSILFGMCVQMIISEARFRAYRRRYRKNRMQNP